MTVQIKGWECNDGTYVKGRVSIVRDGDKAKAFLDGKIFCSIKFVKPGDFVKWMDKAEEFAELIELGGDKCQKA